MSEELCGVLGAVGIPSQRLSAVRGYAPEGVQRHRGPLPTARQWWERADTLRTPTSVKLLVKTKSAFDLPEHVYLNGLSASPLLS